MKVKGKIHNVGALRVVSEKFKSKDVVILTADKYPQFITVQFTQDKTELITENNVGEQVEISINLRGREWKSPTGEIKYFNTIEGWQINAVETAPVLKETPIIVDDSNNDDLPF
jgi:single-strand DNA-binding protein